MAFHRGQSVIPAKRKQSYNRFDGNKLLCFLFLAKSISVNLRTLIKVQRYLQMPLLSIKLTDLDAHKSRLTFKQPVNEAVSNLTILD